MAFTASLEFAVTNRTLLSTIKSLGLVNRKFHQVFIDAAIERFVGSDISTT